MHACPFQTGLHDHFIGTFDHARANGPALVLIRGVLQQRLPLAKIVQWFAGRPQALEQQKAAAHTSAEVDVDLDA